MKFGEDLSNGFRGELLFVDFIHLDIQSCK